MVVADGIHVYLLAPTASTIIKCTLLDVCYEYDIDNGILFNRAIQS